jgi:hypothetical protein
MPILWNKPTSYTKSVVFICGFHELVGLFSAEHPSAMPSYTSLLLIHTSRFKLEKHKIWKYVAWYEKIHFLVFTRRQETIFNALDKLDFIVYSSLFL